MKKTVKELLEHCRKALKNNVQYIYGAKMEVLSLAKIKALQELYGYAYVWQSDLKKAGKMCCDCSGLISSCTAITRSSSGYKQTAEEIVTVAEVKKNWEKYVGWAFWLNGHIGVVSDTRGYYYAMDGSARNMVHYNIDKQNWVYALKLCDIDYTSESEKENDEMVETGTMTVNGRNIKIDKIVKDGVTFIKLRGLENAGFNVGYDANTKNLSLDNAILDLNVTANGVEKTVKAVNLDGFNYCKLRDVAYVTGNIDVGFENGKVIVTARNDI